MQRLNPTAFHWDDVRLFLALSRSSTVGVAAKALGVDASTVSRRLMLLEEAVKATLFDRGRDGVTPTKAAEDLMPVAEEIEAVIQRFTTAAEGLERAVEGLVRLTCPPDVAEVVVAPLLCELRARHPALRFHLAWSPSSWRPSSAPTPRTGRSMTCSWSPTARCGMYRASRSCGTPSSRGSPS